jgi:tRNA(Ile)-lysidine synthase
MAGSRGERLKRPPAVGRVLERVTATVRKHEMALPGEIVLVSVSGGPDSICLLHSLYRLRRLLRIKLEVFHFDHRLRRDSVKDAEYVRDAATRLKLPFHLERAETARDPAMSPEHWAREMRRLATGRVLRETGAHRIAVSHTVDDQAETVLIAAITGSGLDGVAGIRPVLGTWVQPLLNVTRAEVEAFCAASHLRPRRDPTNRDTALLRNAVRLRGLPSMERAAGRDLKVPLARTASVLQEDAEDLRDRALPAIQELVEEVPDGVTLPALGLLALPPPVASRVVHAAILRCSVPPLRDHVEAVLDLARGRPGRRADLGRGLRAVRDREYVQLSRTSPGPGDEERGGL